MKRRKEYMPRTGIRIDRKIQHGVPTGGFIGADIEVFEFTGSVQRSLTELVGVYRVPTGTSVLIDGVPRVAFVLTGTTDIRDSIGSFGAAFETRLLNVNVLGSSIGGLGYENTIVSARTGSIPSWTNDHLGHNAAFVIPTLSSSNHESQVLNAWRSGTEALEMTAVPASSTLYYSKKSTYSKYVAKKSASFFDTVHRNTQGHSIPGQLVYSEYVPSAYVAASGSRFDTASGSTNGAYSLAPGGTSTPAHIYIDVPVSGKLVDIAVWVELHHNSSSLTDAMPLSALAIALKSPNVYPGVSDPTHDDQGFTQAFDGFGIATAFYRNTYILWHGTGHVRSDNVVWAATGAFTPNSVFREKFAGWDRDFSMRTIFHDGASVANPRSNLGMHASGNYNGAPNASLSFNNAWGFGTFWTGSSGSPPAGWLNGPGLTADINEWATTGSSRGTNIIKPFLPMLDAIDIEIAEPAAGDIFPTTYNDRPVKFTGLRTVRKGLRGTEISGTWKLLLAADCGDLDNYQPAYFRQVRLEITYENNIDASIPRISPPTARPRRNGYEEVLNISASFLGTTSSHHVSVLNSHGEIGRTFGIALNTGSVNFSNHALVYRITGTLADISGSAPAWLLNNRFGMPAIPPSSASLVENVVQEVVTIHPQDILATRPILDGAQRLSDAARDAKRPQTRSKYAAALISGTLT